MTELPVPAALISRLCAAPLVSDHARAEQRLENLASSSLAFAALLEAPAGRAVLAGLADHSPYLWRLVRVDPERAARLFVGAPEAGFDRLLAEMRDACAATSDEAEVMRLLRRAKQEAALLIALCDLGGVWDVVAVTAALTRFADAAVACALSFLLRGAIDAGRLVGLDRATPEAGCGVVVLALGKHGAGELNYSSDIDPIVFYDPLTPALAPNVEPAPFFVRMTKALSRLLQERTGDGYVVRVDLRLRPDPGSTAVAISLPAAFNYYETFGQNWERAAMIKARPVAGDVALGHDFLGDLAPFIWRKYFDYAAIADIHAMKRQIHAVRGHAQIAVAGHDVKLGRGGIREVEFFVQTQQLIFGGRRPQLRGSGTLAMLEALAGDGWITREAAHQLRESYLWLRGIEHRLQMIDDEQTQRLPSDPEVLERFARFAGYENTEAFARALTATLGQVEAHYARLFEHAPGLDSAVGSLVFTGVTDDPETILTLERMGFRDASAAVETVRGWHFGRRPAVQSPRAREVLTDLVPALLEAFSGSGDPDAALAAFDQALARMPAAVELFSILRSNQNVRELFGDILGGAPRLARVVVQRPHVLDAAIDPATLQGPRDATGYARRARALVEPPRTTEDFLDSARVLAQEESFLIGVRTLSGMLDPAEAAPLYTALADGIVTATLTHVARVFAQDHGEVPGARCVLIGMGKFGSREMTATSDLDLLLLYEYDDAVPDSDGRRPLHAAQYYGRLAQRLVSALTVATRRGRLYEVDMRLRPSGRQGPVATRVKSFSDYQATEAAVWEHMALTRARVVAGDDSLAREVEEIIAARLAIPRDVAALRREVHDMRGLIAREKGEADGWNLKLAAGGIIDVEFIAQYLALAHANAHREILVMGTGEVLKVATALGLLSAADGELLCEAHRLYARVTQMTRLTLGEDFVPGKIARGVERRIAAAAEAPDFPRLERQLTETRAQVRALFERVMGTS